LIVAGIMPAASVILSGITNLKILAMQLNFIPFCYLLDNCIVKIQLSPQWHKIQKGSVICISWSIYHCRKYDQFTGDAIKFIFFPFLRIFPSVGLFFTSLVIQIHHRYKWIYWFYNQMHNFFNYYYISYFL